MMEDVKIDDGTEVYSFRGERIGFASTKNSQQLRWTEVEIYRTEGGHYVLAKYGRSDVVHRPKATCSSPDLQILPPDDNDKPCPLCQPTLHPSSRVAVEEDRVTVFVATTEEAIRKASMTKRNDEIFLTKVARTALNQAFGRQGSRVVPVA